MTTGKLIFYSGIGLLVLTIVLGIIFWIKKPQYIPENAAYDGAGDKRTQKLRSGYPTDRLTIRREPEHQVTPGTTPIPEDTERLTAEQTAPIAGTDVLKETGILPGTEVLGQQPTEKLAVGTAPLADSTAPLDQVDGTVPLRQEPIPDDGETVLLAQSEQSGDTAQISGTTLLSGD